MNAIVSERPEAPWGKFSVPVTEDMDTKTILKTAGIDWTVEERPLYYNGENKRIKSEYVAHVRSDDPSKCLTVSKQGWHAFQNEDAINHVLDVCKSINAKVRNVGHHRDGQLVFAVAELPEKFALFKGQDLVEGYMILTDVHKYGHVLDSRFTASRYRCWNQLSWKLDRAGDLSVRMRHNSRMTFEEAKDKLLLAHANMKQYKEAATLLSRKYYNEETMKLFYASVFPADNDLLISKAGQQAMDLRETQPGAEFGAGTFWELYNSVTYYIDHVAGRSEGTRFYSSTYGPNAARKQKALNAAVKLAKAS